MGACNSKQYEDQCKVRPSLVEADGDIAGPGVFWGMVVSAYITFLLTGMIWAVDINTTLESKSTQARARKILQSLLINLSDQALFTSLALLATTYFKFCAISVYHAYIVLDLILVAVAIHACSLMVLTCYFHNNLQLKWIRGILISLVYIWWLAFSIQLNKTGQAREDLAWTLACFHNTFTTSPYVQEPRNLIPLSSIAVILMATSVVNLSSKIRYAMDDTSQFLYYVRFVLCYLGPCGCACYGVILLGRDRNRLFVCSDPNAKDSSTCSGWSRRNSTFLADGDYDWTFGQFLAIFLYGLSLTSVVEAYFDPGKDGGNQPPNALSRHRLDSRPDQVQTGTV